MGANTFGDVSLARQRTLGTRLHIWFWRDSTQGYLMVAPGVILLALLVAYPFFLSLWLSMTNKTVGNPGVFVGLSNFTKQWQSQIFTQAFWNTLNYTAVTTVFKLVLGFAIALLLNREFRGRQFVRSSMLLPWIVPTVLSTMAWLWMFDSNLSSINWIARRLGLVQKGYPWLTDPAWAMASVMIVNIWRGIPFFAITILAGLLTIPQELYDAASIDGAGRLRRLVNVTIPLVMPVVTIVLIMSIIGTFSDIQVVYALTGGGPTNSTHVLATLSYRVGLQSGQLGQGAAISLYMFPVLLLMVILEVWHIRRSNR
jgi:multiple sugar transport system permease protein